MTLKLNPDYSVTITNYEFSVTLPPEKGSRYQDWELGEVNQYYIVFGKNRGTLTIKSHCSTIRYLLHTGIRQWLFGEREKVYYVVTSSHDTGMHLYGENGVYKVL